MIKIGDRVKFINDVGVGKVIKIAGSTVTVDREDGFEVPALISELVVVEKEEELRAISSIGVGDYRPGQRGNRPKKAEEKQERRRTSAVARYGKISLADEYEEEEVIDIYSIKEQYTRNMAAVNQIAAEMEQKEKKLQEEKKRAFSSQDVKFENDTSVFEKEDNSAKKALYEEPKEKPKPKVEDKVVAKPKNIEAKKVKNPIEVVDLHSHALLESEQGLKPGEILEIQLNTFIETLNGKIESKQHGKIVFIHGVGSGKLKYEVTRLLRGRFSSLAYQDASFREYGYGAVMVIY